MLQCFKIQIITQCGTHVGYFSPHRCVHEPKNKPKNRSNDTKIHKNKPTAIDIAFKMNKNKQDKPKVSAKMNKNNTKAIGN